MSNIILKATKEQQEIICSPAKRIAVFAGRRWGKSFMVLNRVVRQCLGTGGFIYLYCAQSCPQYEEMLRLLSECQGLQPFIKQKWSQPPCILFRNGSMIYFRSLGKPEGIRGSCRPNEICVDEVQDAEEQSVQSVLRPMVADTRGAMVFAGQFRGTEDWRYRMFLEGQDKGQNRIRSWVYPTSTGYLFRSKDGQDELEALRRETPPLVFAQEYECIPSANQAAVFAYEDIKAAKRGFNHSGPVGGHEYIIGWDIGRVVDPSAGVVIDATAGQVVHSEIRPHGEHYEQGARYLESLCAKWGCCTAMVDTTGGATGGHKEQESVVGEYRKYVKNIRPVYFNTSIKEQHVNELALRLQQKKIAIPQENEALLKQLSTYEYKRKGDRYIYSAPEGNGNHDDLVAALYMANWGVTKGYAQRGQPLPAGIF